MAELRWVSVDEGDRADVGPLSIVLKPEKGGCRVRVFHHGRFVETGLFTSWFDARSAAAGLVETYGPGAGLVGFGRVRTARRFRGATSSAKAAEYPFSCNSRDSAT